MTYAQDRDELLLEAHVRGARQASATTPGAREGGAP